MSTAGLRHVLTLFNTVIFTCSAHFTQTALSLSGMRSTCICIEISIFFVTDFVALLGGQLDTMNVTYFSLHCISAWSAYRSIYLSLPTLYFMSLTSKLCDLLKPTALTLRGWPGKAFEASPEPWQSSRAPSSSGNQLPSGAGSLPPWSWERSRQQQGSTRQSEHFSLLAFGPKHCLGDWMDEAAWVLLTCGLCELCRRRR